MAASQYFPYPKHPRSEPTTIKVAYRVNVGIPAELISQLARKLADFKRELQERETKARAARAHRLRVARKRARQTGYRCGKNAAIVEALALQAHLSHSYDQIISRAHHDCLNLAISCAREVISDQAICNTPALWERVRRGLRHLLHANGITLYAHPSQIEALAKHRPSLTKPAISAIATDERLAAGNVRIETGAGNIELSWEEHLDLLTTHLQEVLNQTLMRQRAIDELAAVSE